MSDENSSESVLEEKPGKTADQLLEEIQSKDRQLNDKGASKEEATPEASEPEPTPETARNDQNVVEQPSDKPLEPASTSEPGEPPVPFAEKDKAETEEWMKKKGFKSVQDMGKSLRELERKLHSRGKSEEEGIPAPKPAASFMPQGQNETQNPPQGDPRMVDALARKYRMSPDDVERLGEFANDIAAFQTKQQIGPLMKELNEMKQAHSVRSMREQLENDPAFQNPEVQREMHEILENDSATLRNEPVPMKAAFDKALQIVGRRMLNGSGIPVENPTPSGNGIQRPPPSRTGGKGSIRAGSPLRPAGYNMTDEAFRNLPLAEMEKVMKSRGIFKEEE